MQGVNVQSHEITQEQFKDKIAQLLVEQTGMSSKMLDVENQLIQAQMESRSLQKQINEQITTNQYLEDENGALKNKLEH